GSLVCNHDFIWDEKCPPSWCNGDTIAFNPQFFTWMTPASRLTVLVHELWRTGYDQLSRLAEFNRCPDLWNKAADYVINNKLDHWGFDFSQLMEIQPCLDHQYDDMTTEQVYALLEKNQQGQPMPQPSPGNGQAQQNPGQNSSQGPGTPGLGGDLRKPLSPEAAAAVKGKLVQAAQASKMAK